ncbi:MAG: rhodanese-like domain-containing protein [Micrococcales bacterium]|nr:rhodanese-like domain-containing protein [Micrococcales bacterium]
MVLDVREPAEHAERHLPDDRLLPLAELLADPSRAGSAPVLVYCASGRRSAVAADALVAAGVDAVSLRGGIAALPPALTLSPSGHDTPLPRGT